MNWKFASYLQSAFIAGAVALGVVVASADVLPDILLQPGDSVTIRAADPTSVPPSPVPTATPSPSPTSSPAPSPTPGFVFTQWDDWGFQISPEPSGNVTMNVYNAAGTRINTRPQADPPYCAYGDANTGPNVPCFVPNLTAGTYTVEAVVDATDDSDSFETVVGGAPTSTPQPSPTSPPGPTSTPAPTSTPPPGGAQPLTSSINSPGTYSGSISSGSGDCVTVNADNVTIINANIGPCNGRGILITGAQNVTVRDSTVDNNRTGSCCDRYTTIRVHNSDHVDIVGNRLERGETILAITGGSQDVLIEDNIARDPKGPFPRGQFVQIGGDFINTGPVTIRNNDYSCARSRGCFQEDAINIWRGHDILVEGNDIDTGNSLGRSSGCGIIIEGFGPATIRNNTVANVQLPSGTLDGCGIAVSGGTNILIEGNSVSGYGNVAYYCHDYSGAPSPNGVTFHNNFAGPGRDSFWSGTCSGLVESGNSWN